MLWNFLKEIETLFAYTFKRYRSGTIYMYRYFQVDEKVIYLHCHAMFLVNLIVGLGGALHDNLNNGCLED